MLLRGQILPTFRLNSGAPIWRLPQRRRSIVLDPGNSVASVILTRAQMHTGQTDQALATCRRAIAQRQDGADLHGLLLELAFARHDLSAVADQLAWAKGKSAEPYMRLQEALIDFAQGRNGAALETFQQLIDGYKKQGMLERANRIQGAVPRIEAELGLLDDARELLHRLPPINGSTDIPVAIAETGDTSHAEAALLEDLQKFPQDTLWQNVKGPQIRGAIALSRHKPKEAVEALRPGFLTICATSP